MAFVFIRKFITEQPQLNGQQTGRRLAWSAGRPIGCLINLFDTQRFAGKTAKTPFATACSQLLETVANKKCYKNNKNKQQIFIDCFGRGTLNEA